jgi:hypothetical protein
MSMLQPQSGFTPVQQKVQRWQNHFPYMQEDSGVNSMAHSSVSLFVFANLNDAMNLGELNYEFHASSFETVRIFNRDCFYAAWW